ncbi:polyhydroxyalkanoate depolymerase [Burkholderia thailandensis]|uniref:Polyhydroxyalkanoate depolymerase, intracellular family protein n=5 Tax=Burkholderia thailandensis TaxID=57975 RepID=A0AAW9CWB1_BURTH|nr:polyhydroxyalkanoate depolymerase [Burkholderia thailandensis]ABC35349.1 intracellular polyhydroxyalkanoate depolymerase [Burkholderia thailandensis E264]AHI67455.1 polyhydroxyalkanoate depolymerase, intracellular family protein [Burkholderia thailandensis H0587]AHI77195.1 polyhydroxyalkanoate depolymerase, intracellular family protein [Burkholderia thailandensis 2002721723]AHI82315.1 polyhydroxyalkanoate depolymerase, intracellular family protein [Burkholderia thailandensis E444]AIC90208.1
MLYAWLEAQREFFRACQPWTGAAQRANASARSAGWPTWGPMAHAADAIPKPPPFAIASVMIDGAAVPVDERVVDDTPFCALRKFSRRLDGGAAARPAVFLCTPLAGHHAVMLRETVETMLATRDVYVTDWRNARDVPPDAGAFGLDDYVCTLERFIAGAAESGLHVMAVCQATVPALAAAALLAARGVHVASVALLGGPIDTRSHPTLVDRFALEHDLDWFRCAAIDVVPPPYAGAGRRVYPGFIQHAAIVVAHPQRRVSLESRYWAAWMTGDLACAARCMREMNEYGAVLDMTERYFLDTIRVIFHERLLAQGRWSIGSRRVAPEQLTRTALCTIEGGRDDIAGAGQTHAAHALCNAVPDAGRERITEPDCDHYDLFLGPRWRHSIHPALDAFWTRAEAARRAAGEPPRAAPSAEPEHRIAH